jgi:DNA-binding beta-propeller fold protein YncE
VPASLAFDAAGQLLMTQPADDRVLVLGTSNETLGVLGAGRLRSPSAVAVAPTGEVYVGDDHGVSRYAAGGAKLGRWATDAPGGLAVAPDGSVVATGHGVVRRFAADGALLGAYAADDPRGVAARA